MTPVPKPPPARHPEVFALVAICLICIGASRSSERMELRLSTAPYQVEQRSTLMCARTQTMVDKLQTKIDAAVTRLQERVQARRPRLLGL